MVLLLHYQVCFCRFYSGLLWLRDRLLGFYVVGWSLYVVCVVIWRIFSVWLHSHFLNCCVALFFFCFQWRFLYWFFLPIRVGFVMIFRSLELFLSYVACFQFFFFIKVPLLLWWAVQCPLLLFKDFLSYTLFISCWIISWFYLFYILHRILFLLIVWSLLHVLLLA